MCGLQLSKLTILNKLLAFFASPSEGAKRMNDVERLVSWQTCTHKFLPYFGPALMCAFCAATTMVSMDRKSKPIHAPATYEAEGHQLIQDR